MYNNYMWPTGMNWVNGIEGAKTFPMMPNDHAVLFDILNEGIFYIKSCDRIGMCSIRTFKYEENVTVDDASKNNYVTKDELKKALEELLNHEQSVQQPIRQFATEQPKSEQQTTSK